MAINSRIWANLIFTTRPHAQPGCSRWEGKRLKNTTHDPECTSPCSNANRRLPRLAALCTGWLRSAHAQVSMPAEWLWIWESGVLWVPTGLPDMPTNGCVWASGQVPSPQPSVDTKTLHVVDHPPPRRPSLGCLPYIRINIWWTREISVHLKNNLDIPGLSA